MPKSQWKVEKFNLAIPHSLLRGGFIFAAAESAKFCTLGACPRKKSLKNNVLELRRGDLKISPFSETRVLTGDQNFLIFSKNT
jgi:hypothetical protein